MEKAITPAYDELKLLLKHEGYKYEKLIIVSDRLFNALHDEMLDPFMQYGERKRCLFYKNRSMISQKLDYNNGR